jgi:hypothetical protein
MAALTADVAFQQAANAAAAAYASRPAYVTYVTRTHISAPSMNQSVDINRAVMTRSSDNVAILQDLPNGAQTVAPAFPISPTFDALSYFRLTFSVGWHKRLFTNLTGPNGNGPIIPITFQNVAHSEGDVVVTSLRYYYPKFSPDSSDAPDGRTHLVLQALRTLTIGNSSDFYLSDLLIDNATMLPAQVTYTGKDQRKFVVDYETVDGHWVIKHASFEQTEYGVLHVGSVHFKADTEMTDYKFPDTPPDPRLAPPRT